MKQLIYEEGVQARLTASDRLAGVYLCPYPAESEAAELWFLGYYEEDQFSVSYRKEEENVFVC